MILYYFHLVYNPGHWIVLLQRSCRQETAAQTFDQTLPSITAMIPAIMFIYANWWLAGTFISAFDSAFTVSICKQSWFCMQPNLKLGPDRRGSSWIRCDRPHETLAGKQTLHKSLHSHLQLFTVDTVKEHANSAVMLQGSVIFLCNDRGKQKMFWRSE